ncbi:MAG: DUF1850 domain-containing protein [Sterolibacteriaceae bacterium MAG5]|nr:DUF1850 domain-containing protein [Candidatus Nitricoxidireducens bremensis]
MPLCLTAGMVAATLAADAFTLAWTHSIEKIRWEEDWRVEKTLLVATEARIRGTGAGMEPPPGAVFESGVWRYRPALAPQEALRLTHSPHTAGYELCVAGRCSPLAEHLPSIGANAVIELKACP